MRHESISRQHAALLHAERDTFVMDLGSASGTFVDGVRVPSGQTRQLHEGAVISLGECKSTYTLVAAKASGVQPPQGQKRKR